MIDTIQLNGVQSSSADARRMVLRSELEATREAFDCLLQKTSTSKWHDKSPSSEWTIGQVLVHLMWAIEFLPEEVRRARQGRGMFNLPKRLSDTLSYWYIRWLACTVTPNAIGRRYSEAIAASIRLLDVIPDEDWHKGGEFYGEGFHTVEDLFHIPAQHLTEHTSGL